MRLPRLLLLPLLCGGLMQGDARYWLKVQELLEVQEGLCVQVPCTFYHRDLRLNSDFNVYWFHKKGDHLMDTLVATNNRQTSVRKDAQSRFNLLRDPRTPNCSLSISDARRSDTGTYFFRVEQGRVTLSYKEKQQQLHIRVKALTQKPAIHISEPLVSGHVGQLICSLPGACHKTNLSFSWTGEMINPNTEASSELNLTPGPQDHGRNLTCQVTLLRTGETTEKTIRLNVFYAPRKLTTHVSFRDASGLGNQSVQLFCRSDSNPPAELTWLPESHGNVTITQNTATLELHLSEIPEDQEFTCQARNYLGSQTESVRLSEISAGFPLQLEGQALSYSYSAHGHLVPVLHWLLEHDLLPGNCSDASDTPTTCNSESQGWWPLLLMLIRGTLMGVGFVLTYVLSWVYYSRVNFE